MIAAGNERFFGCGESSPWILNVAGATSPQPRDVRQYVPAEALGYYLSCVLFRAWADLWGNIDVAAHIRLDPAFDFEIIAQLGGSRLPVGALVESQGNRIYVPNVNDRSFFWHISGNTLGAGVDLSLALTGFRLP